MRPTIVSTGKCMAASVIIRANICCLFNSSAYSLFHSWFQSFKVCGVVVCPCVCLYYRGWEALSAVAGSEKGAIVWGFLELFTARKGFEVKSQRWSKAQILYACQFFFLSRLFYSAHVCLRFLSMLLVCSENNCLLSHCSFSPWSFILSNVCLATYLTYFSFTNPQYNIVLLCTKHKCGLERDLG